VLPGGYMAGVLSLGDIITYHHRLWGDLKVKVIKLNFTENSADILETTCWGEIMYHGIPMKYLS
jgi:hypothetical protein